MRATATKTPLIREFFTPAKLEALNTELERLGLAASDIVSILLVPGTAIGTGPGDRFRVLYRVDA